MGDVIITLPAEGAYVQSAGLTPVYIGQKGAKKDKLYLLGYTRSGAETSTEAFYGDVKADAHGGEDGPPVDIFFLGEVAKVRLELTKWDAVVADNIDSRAAGVATGGGTVDPGTLLFANGPTMMYRVLLDSPSLPRNYPNCMVRAPIELNRGTKYATLVVEFEAYKDNTYSGSPTENTLYNADTT